MAEGRIAGIEPLPGTAPGPRRLAMPALVNAHDHARTFRSATLGAAEQPLETWLAWLGVLPGVDPWLCAATSFARSARSLCSAAASTPSSSSPCWSTCRPGTAPRARAGT